MLDIANSFLNSPLMHHLSNMESKNSEISSKESSHPNTVKKGVRVNNFDPKSPHGLARSPNNRYEPDAEYRGERIGPGHPKYDEWVGVYRQEPRPHQSNSNLKESSNRRYGDYGVKDSSILIVELE
jgi:hypothetical protein